MNFGDKIKAIKNMYSSISPKLSYKDVGLGKLDSGFTYIINDLDGWPDNIINYFTSYRYDWYKIIAAPEWEGETLYHNILIENVITGKRLLVQWHQITTPVEFLPSMTLTVSYESNVPNSISYEYNEPGNPPVMSWYNNQFLGTVKGVPTFDYEPSPIPMILACPKCHTQHIDTATETWDNPPHRKHLCLFCGTLWKPANVATIGVEKL